MCGISGIIGTKANLTNITKMTDALYHRGNDNISHFISDGLALGHNRLSIIDLDASANQPYQKTGQPYTLVYNGEIYNYIELREELSELGHQFETSSDTEVLYEAFLEWGGDCLERLNGMFAFAIWNDETKNLFAARDRFGVKPFYYYQDKENFIFASEIKAIRKHVNVEVNKKVLANYMMFGSYGLPEETFYETIHQLPASHLLKFNQDAIKVMSWYNFVERVQKKRKELEGVKEHRVKHDYKQLLEESIALRFRADVPVGFTISGGVDSSLLLALVNQREDAKNIKGFTFYTDDERYDELPWVEKMVETTSTELHKVIFNASEANEAHDKLSKIQDEPYGGIPTLAYAKLFEEIAEQGIKVVLDGQGMDEAWAGYDYYQSDSSQTIQGQSNNSPFKASVLSEDLKAYAKKPEYPKPFGDELLDKQYRDLFYTKIPRALRFNDRISMASTTELREPFLDYRLVEYAFSLPKAMKIREGQGKYVLRQILSDYRKDVALAPKRPLQTPQREWLGEELSFMVEEAIENIEKSSFVDYFKIDEIRKEWQFYKQGSQESSFHLWQWISISELIDHEE
ncbi:asparagine synthase (glutamine-hydrolyzing) [Psychroflexus sediminis]|uniref:asparagine synthase (glutamine-hydrolyzing) n=1 Tax=Psychroflexus sediminis TaxID=470826 RepID=A0A1G7Z446_9FLAO|nr:asparagine synthase (glutamine-hydrolyzing) [Psychroflexus sediminis]SDH03521.1 asparagine synthase (glutamine-hydrolysing) [Psychroflexus sediminis]